ncbi:MAG: hypothetical protein HY000_01440 [Planctomycetes bacterium]|nr:hypothetical protein [Planctomycetota bacterium]
MGHRWDVLQRHNLECHYEFQPKYLGCTYNPIAKLCFVKLPPQTGVAVHCTRQSRLDVVKHLYATQNRVPHLAKILRICEDVAVFEFAQGSLLWHLETVDVEFIQTRLRETVQALRDQDVVHGDIRPWNVVLSRSVPQQLWLIDWDLAIRISSPDQEIINNHLRDRGHSGRPLEEIDLADLQRSVNVIRGEITPEQAWNHDPNSFGWRPPWCRSP